jgi:phosphoglycerate dehydrogenase-like enzyme
VVAHPTLWITHRGERHQHAALNSAPAEVAVTMRRSPSREEILALLPEMEFLVSERTGTIDADMIATGKKLRLIQRLGSHTYDIDLEAAKAADIPVCYAPVRGCVLVAEHMLMQILALAKRVRELMAIVQEGRDFGYPPRQCDEDYFAYNWSGYKGVVGLWGSTVGILGMGEIGGELARLLRPFSCSILYNKRNRLPEDSEVALGAQFATVDEMLARSDVICMLLPFFPETEQSLSRDFFAAMKPGSLFVSAGGSGVVDEVALAEALRAGHLAGAALDTYTLEPVAADDPLRALALADPRANVILTPHTAAGTGPIHPTQPRAERAEDYDNILRCLRGEPLKGRLV